jgi:hypothetical protein
MYDGWLIRVNTYQPAIWLFITFLIIQKNIFVICLKKQKVVKKEFK